MKLNRFICLIIPAFLSCFIHAQSFNNYYPDTPINDIAGYPNAAYNSETKTYFLVEYDRQIEIAFNSALHVKKVDEFGTLIDERYFITDFNPYSGHYISGVQVQGDEIVVFINRNVSYPHIHDVFIIRVKQDLSGTPTSKRLYLDGSDPQFNSISINEVVPFGDRLAFTGSVFTRGDLNFPASASKLVMGFVKEDGSVIYEIFQHDADLIEGLSLLPRPKADELYVSCRFIAKDEKSVSIDLPLIVKMTTTEESFIPLWGKLYPELRVDQSNYTSYNEGIEIPLIESFTDKNVPAFLARDAHGANLIFVPFSRVTGSHITTSVRRIVVPGAIELIDAVKMSETKNGIAVLFTRQEPYNLWNTESYLLTCPNLYGFLVTPHWQNLASPDQTNALQARKILVPAKGELAIAGLANTVEWSNSGYYRASLMKSDDVTFDCIPHKKLDTPQAISLTSKDISLKLSPVPVKAEERTMEYSLSVPSSTYNLCEPLIVDERAQALGTDALPAIEPAEMLIYPNPAQTNISITFPKNETIQTIQVQDIQGNLVYSSEVLPNQNTLMLNTASFTPGIYFVTLTTAGSDTVDKKRLIIVQ